MVLSPEDKEVLEGFLKEAQKPQARFYGFGEEFPGVFQKRIPVMPGFIPKDIRHAQVAADFTDMPHLAPGPDQKRIKPVEDLKEKAEPVYNQVSPFQMAQFVDKYMFDLFPGKLGEIPLRQ